MIATDVNERKGSVNSSLLDLYLPMVSREKGNLIPR